MIADLAKFEEVASTTLGAKEKLFVLRGLGALADDLLVSSSRYIRFANAFGVRKVRLTSLLIPPHLSPY